MATHSKRCHNRDMKKRLIAIVCAATIVLLPAIPACASPRSTTDVAADALVVRPLSFLATILGSVTFVVTLPFTAPACGVHTAAHALVEIPAQYTFCRELGDTDSLDVDTF